MKRQTQIQSRARSGRAFPYAILAATLLLTARGAQAGPIVLPDAVSDELFGLNFAMNILTSSTVGTLTYTGHPGCGNICTATTGLGSDPFASLTVNEVPFQGTGGGGAQAMLGYYVEYVSPISGPVAVNLHAPEVVSITDGVTSASAYLGFGPAGGSPGSFNDFSGYTLQEAYCVDGCPSPGFAGITPAPFASDIPVQIAANTPYFIALELMFRPDSSGQTSTGFIDPQFSTMDTAGAFVFSPGVTGSSPSPEPGSLALMLSGAVLLGGWLRRGRNVARQE